ncbi:MAG: hypothetical protein R6U19_08795 [Bacteroidales bacterium]
MEEKKLSLSDVLSNGFKIGFKNIISLILAYILWVITIWIPYLNVGTTIAMMSLPLSLSKGKMISPTEIFDGKYRRYMGEFFMLQGLKSIVLLPALLFMIVPAIIISISWSLALLILIDKGTDPSSALKESNKLTYGHKVTMFLSYLILSIPLIIPFLNFIYLIIYIPVILGAQAYIYQQLSD